MRLLFCGEWMVRDFFGVFLGNESELVIFGCKKGELSVVFKFK